MPNVHSFDDTNWPRVLVRWQGEVTNEAVDAFLTRLDGWLARQQRFALLIDSRGAKPLDHAQRERVMAHMREHRGENGKYLVQAFVIDSLWQQTLYSAVNWAFPPPYPTRAFSEPAAAWAWLDERLRE